jgi:hypothetical protein
MTSSNLVGPGSNPGGPVVAGRSGPVIWRTASADGRRSRRVRAPRPVYTPRPRRTSCCGPDRFRLSTTNRRSRVRVPPGASLAPVAQLAEQFRVVTHTTAADSPSAGRRGSVISRTEGRPRTSHPAAASLAMPHGGHAGLAGVAFLERVTRSSRHDRGIHRPAGRSRAVIGLERLASNRREVASSKLARCLWRR